MARLREPASPTRTEAQRARLRALWALVEAENTPTLRQALAECIEGLEGVEPPGVLKLISYRLRVTDGIEPIREFVTRLTGGEP